MGESSAQRIGGSIRSRVASHVLQQGDERNTGLACRSAVQRDAPSATLATVPGNTVRRRAARATACDNLGAASSDDSACVDPHRSAAATSSTVVSTSMCSCSRTGSTTDVDGSVERERSRDEELQRTTSGTAAIAR